MATYPPPHTPAPGGDQGCRILTGRPRYWSGSAARPRRLSGTTGISLTRGNPRGGERLLREPDGSGSAKYTIRAQYDQHATVGPGSVRNRRSDSQFGVPRSRGLGHHMRGVPAPRAQQDASYHNTSRDEPSVAPQRSPRLEQDSPGRRQIRRYARSCNQHAPRSAGRYPGSRRVWQREGNSAGTGAGSRRR